jgi:putative methionine-R-sulfoxide reductase with GAF domain
MDRGDRPGAAPDNSIFGRDRRRARRHRVHTPAYASLSGSAQGAAVELSEILNISERGMCIQASSPMKVNRLLPLCLELSVTQGRLHLVGHVVWSEPSGKTGIRFPDISEPMAKQLHDWLEANARAEVAATLSATQDEGAMVPVRAVQLSPTFSPGYTSLVSEWAEIEKEVEMCGPDLDPALHLIAQRALTLTWASGTAIALINQLQPSEMVCRARAGTDSPELGARLDVNSGFSGECIRLGKAIACDDTEYDSRVDRKSCRALGIRSIVACPVKRREEIIGILEVFSPEPAAFWENDITVLQKLTRYIARAVQRAEHAREDVLAFATGGGDGEASKMAAAFGWVEPGTVSRTPPLRKAALAALGVACLAGAGWMLAPQIAKLAESTFAIPSAAEADSSPETYALLPLPELHKLANQGDPAAEYALGKRYANGEGVKQDYRVAKDWFLRAAEQGHVRAEGKVAAAFWSGKGAPRDYSKAYFWALLAQAGGDEASPAIMMNSAAHLSPGQIAAEQKHAEQWRHSHHIETPAESSP